MFVLDTNVLSELRKTHADQSVVRWVSRQHDDELYTTAMNIYEIKKGILHVPANDTRQVRILNAWFTKVLDRFDKRILPMTASSALEAAVIGQQTNIDLKDCVIGSIANEHDMTVATRNSRHLARVARRVVNPWPDGESSA